MSRSRRKTSIRGRTTANSEKLDRQKSNRKLRRLVKERMKKREEVLPVLREISDVWDFKKDGKGYDPHGPEEIMRK